MSGADHPQGPGWWQASDGKYYPPQTPPAPLSVNLSGGIPAPPGLPETPSAEGFFKSLFDLSFTRFVTPSIIKGIFVLAIVLWSVYALILFAVLANEGGGAVALALIAVPVFWLVGVVYSRVMLEVIMVLFRIERNTRKNP